MSPLREGRNRLGGERNTDTLRNPRAPDHGTEISTVGSNGDRSAPNCIVTVAVISGHTLYPERHD